MDLELNKDAKCLSVSSRSNLLDTLTELLPNIEGVYCNWKSYAEVHKKSAGANFGSKRFYVSSNSTNFKME